MTSEYRSLGCFLFRRCGICSSLLQLSMFDVFHVFQSEFWAMTQRQRQTLEKCESGLNFQSETPWGGRIFTMLLFCQNNILDLSLRSHACLHPVYAICWPDSSKSLQVAKQQHSNKKNKKTISFMHLTLLHLSCNKWKMNKCLLYTYNQDIIYSEELDN